jgi:hypothetical protein
MCFTNDYLTLEYEQMNVLEFIPVISKPERIVGKHGEKG